MILDNSHLSHLAENVPYIVLHNIRQWSQNISGRVLTDLSVPSSDRQQPGLDTQTQRCETLWASECSWWRSGCFPGPPHSQSPHCTWSSHCHSATSKQVVKHFISTTITYNYIQFLMYSLMFVCFSENLIYLLKTEIKNRDSKYRFEGDGLQFYTLKSI